jgi:membrane associated rhomboid family serine protease
MFPYKDDNPSRTFPFVTVSVILANVAAFAYQLRLGPLNESFIYNFGAISKEIWTLANLPNSQALPPLLSLFSSMFLHGGFGHIIGNMLYLWIFGDNVEDEMGHLSFLLFYLVCGAGAALFNIALSKGSVIPMIGASGAISGVLGAYLVRFPWAKIHVLFFVFVFIRVIRLPALLVLGVWFAMQLFNSLPAYGHLGGGVAWFAHVGGFVMGVVIMLFLRKT